MAYLAKLCPHEVAVALAGEALAELHVEDWTLPSRFSSVGISESRSSGGFSISSVGDSREHGPLLGTATP